jgi:prolyl-tRNA editing enzyme YbaK/EbsC (Cys-tRNA(Pro) deacylase)
VGVVTDVVTDGPTPTVLDRVVRRLSDLGLAHRVTTHVAVTTSQEAAAARGTELATGAKALFVKHREGFVLFVVPADTQLDWKKVKALGYRGARMGTDAELLEATGLVKGSVPPLGNLFGLAVRVDHRVSAQPSINFNAGSLTDSVAMRGEDLLAAAEAEEGDFATPPR